MDASLDRFLGALLGLAVGDAVGTTVEFKPRGTFPPVTDMVGGGPFGLEPGQWTDDTSMALCLASSLVERNGFDARDQMERYCRWLDQGYLSSTAAASTSASPSATRCSSSSRRASRLPGPRIRERPATARSCGSPRSSCTFMQSRGGSPLRGAELDDDACTTECVDACRLMASMLLRGFDGASKEEVLLGDGSFVGAPRIEAIARGDWRKKSEQQIAVPATSCSHWKPRPGACGPLIHSKPPSCARSISATTPTQPPRSPVRLPERCTARKAFRRRGSGGSRCET